MAVRIRLMRMGSKRRPFFRFVVTDSRGKRDGGFLDQIGYYNPIERPLKIEVDEDRIFDWLSKGAQLSDGAKSLLKKAGTLARWDAKRTGREAPDKTLPIEEAPAPAPAAREEAAEEAPEAAAGAEEAPKEAPAEKATGKKDLADDAASEEVSGADSSDKEAEEDMEKGSQEDPPKE
jgi:small subunit ribosomal protein S16